MEHYSKDKVFIRGLNTLFFVFFIIANVIYIFFNGDNSFIKIINEPYHMMPYKFLYIIHAVVLLFLLLFIISQVEPSNHGIKKKVIENYNLFIPASFLFLILHLHFLSVKNYKISTLFVFLATLMIVVIYSRAQSLKKYMYSDEIRLYLTPFSMLLSWCIVVLIITTNIMLTDNIQSSSALFIILAFLELIFILVSSALNILLFRDFMFIAIQVLYLIALVINSKLNGYFMPIGYLSFLTIILITVFWNKLSTRKN